MGRKGTSKRKPSKVITKPLTSSSGSVSSVLSAVESKPVKTLDPGKSGGKPSSDGKKKSKKG